MLTAIAIQILPEDYAKFRSLIRDDERLPATFEEWKKRTDAADAARAKGYVLNKIIVRPGPFAEYCGATGQAPSYHLLDAFATKEARK